MTHTKTNFGSINNVLEEIFGTLHNNNWSKPAAFSPLVNVVESENEYFIDIVAPGLQKSDFAINIENDILTVSYEKTEQQDSAKYHRKDFSLSSFKRSFTIQKNVDATLVAASYENGILTITLPKKEEAKPSSLKVEIK